MEKTEKANVCDRCKKKKEVISHCVVCNQSFCENCTQKHNTNVATKKHLNASSGGTTIQIIDIEQSRNVRIITLNFKQDHGNTGYYLSLLHAID